MNNSAQINHQLVNLPHSPASTRQHAAIPELPSELCKQILSYLEAQGIAIAQSVSKNWHMQPRDHLDILTARIRSQNGRISSDELQAFINLLGGNPTTPYARTIIQLIKTLHFTTGQRWFHSELRHGLGLERLDFSSATFTDEQILAAAPALLNIRQLNFSNCPNLTDLGFFYTRERYPNVNAISFYPQVTDWGLKWATEFYRQNLRTIQLLAPPNHLNITDTGLMMIAGHCTNLAELNLENLSNVSNFGLCSVAHACPPLRTLHLKHLPRISDQSLIAIAGSCPQLQNLHLEDLEGISDAGLIAVTRGCTNIRNLFLKGLLQLTGIGILTSVQNCQNLDQIDLVDINSHWKRKP